LQPLARLPAHLPARQHGRGRIAAHLAQPRAPAHSPRALRSGLRGRHRGLRGHDRVALAHAFRDRLAPARRGAGARRHPRRGAGHARDRRADAAPRQDPLRPAGGLHALPHRALPRLVLRGVRSLDPGVSAARSGGRRTAQRRAGRGRGRHSDRGRRGVQHAARLSRRRPAAPDRVEGARARAGAPHQGLQRDRLERALDRLERRPRAGRGIAPFDPRAVGAQGGRIRASLRPAAAGHEHRGRPRRHASRALPRGARALRGAAVSARAYSPHLDIRNVGWLLASMLFVVAPHLLRLPYWVGIFFIVVVGWRAWISWSAIRFPPRLVVAAITVAAAVGTFLQYGRITGREGGVTLLVVMSALKLLEMRTQREVALSIYLGFFLVLTNFLFSQTIPLGLYLLACVWIFTGTLIGFNRMGGAPSVVERLRPAAALLVQA